MRMQSYFALLVLCFGIVLSPAAAFANPLPTITVLFQGVMTSGSDTDVSGSLVGLPFTATVVDTPGAILNDGRNGQVTITPTSFSLEGLNGGPMRLGLSIGGQYLGTAADGGGEDILSGGSAGAGNNFSFRLFPAVAEFIPENPNGSNPSSLAFSASGNFVGTAPYIDPFSGVGMSSPGTGTVSFNAQWQTINFEQATRTLHQITGTADITGIVVSGVPEPSTWAMLILGVAMIGLAARRRRGGMVLAA